jgi:nitrite reductase/ring-hydroxylating ferredoxin subunit
VSSQDTGSSSTGLADWTALDGIDAETTAFPARARLNDETIVVFKTKTGLRGTSRSCPHMLATMMQAELTANDTMVRCPLHVFTFRLSDGKGVNCAGFRISVYEIREVGPQFVARLVAPIAPSR